jgi:hypothetical protein
MGGEHEQKLLRGILGSVTLGGSRYSMCRGSQMNPPQLWQ